jgi:hypothetical protein
MVAFVKSKPRFQLGQIVATPAALQAIQQAGQSPVEFLDRHARGDWGELCDDDRQLNDAAVECGSRILSAYHMKSGAKIWIITEAADDDGQREATTILLPDEY